MSQPAAPPRDIIKDRIDFERECDEDPIPGLLTSHDIMTRDWKDPEWIVPQYLPAGLTIMAGKPKVGKSWLALQIALAVATGGRALGQKIELGGVFYMAMEDPPRRLKQRMIRQGWPTRELPVDFMTIGDFETKIGDLRNGGGIRLAEQIAAKKYRLVILDTLSRCIKGDQNDVDMMTSALTPLQETSHACNCSILMLDHHKKGGIETADAVSDILGSTAKGAMADCVWGLYKERGKTDGKLSILGRDVVEVNLVMSIDWELGCWQSEGDADELELTERRQEILDVLVDMSGIGKCNDIAKKIKVDRSNTFRRLQAMVDGGFIQRVPIGGEVFYSAKKDE